jgi:hypothetical protein
MACRWNCIIAVGRIRIPTTRKATVFEKCPLLGHAKITGLDARLEEYAISFEG